MGSYLVRLYPLVIGLYFQFKTNIKKKIIFSIFLLLVFFMIVNSGERASIALMIFSFFIILIFSPIKFFYKKVLLISMPFFLFLMLYSNPYLKARVVDNTINLLNENKTEPYINIKYNINDYLKNQDKIYSKSINNFLFKISTIEINFANKEKILLIINDKIIKYKKLVEIFTNIVRGSNLSYLFDNYIILYNYLINIKIINTYIILYRYIKSNQYELFSSRIKIFNQEYSLKKKYFVYKYEALFELINGTELYDEQMERYISIINEYNIFNNYTDKYHLTKPNKDYCENINMIEYSQSGGSSYPLHHFINQIYKLII